MHNVNPYRATRCTKKHVKKPPRFIPHRGEIFRASRCTLQYEITLFDGARFLTRAFYINRLSAHAVKRALSKALNHVPCVIHSCNKLHATGNYARDVSVVQQNARDNMEKTRGWANVKQCKLKVWGVAVVDLWLFFAYHAEVKV